MRNRRIVLVFVPLLLAIVLIASASIALAKDGGNRFEIVVFPVLEADIPIDQGWVLQDRMETLDGQYLGWDGGRCISVDPDPLVDDRYMCELVFHFPDGDIVAAGAFGIPDFVDGGVVFAVTGGSEAFRRVSGDVEVIPSEDFSESRVIFRITGSGVHY